MNNYHLDSNSLHTQLAILSNKYHFSPELIGKFMHYLELLIEWNKKFNLTAITNPEAIIHHHFDDSLAITKYIDLGLSHSLCDVGTGAGFPSIPLKILFPHLTTILIEVNNKKRTFLAEVSKKLELGNNILYPFDWRTFLRTTHYSVDYFVARASLQPEELVRIFKPTSSYKESTLIYWAAQQWTAQKIESPFVEKEIAYTIDTVNRKFVFFKQIRQH